MKSVLILITALLLGGCVTKRKYVDEYYTTEPVSQLSIKLIEKRNELPRISGAAENVTISRLVEAIEKRSNLKITLSRDVQADERITFAIFRDDDWINFLERILTQNGLTGIKVDENVIRVARRNKELSEEVGGHSSGQRSAPTSA